MHNSDAQHRTEPATPRRREKARRKGVVARSADLTGAVVMLAMLVCLPAAIVMIGSGFVHGLRQAFQSVPSEVEPASLHTAVLLIAGPAMPGMTLLLCTAMAVGLAANFAQVGFAFSGEALAPTLERINPLNGLKRLFSRQAAFDAFKALAKSILFALVAWSCINAHMADIVSLHSVPPFAALSIIGSLLKTLAIRVGTLWLVLAIVDYAFQRKQVGSQLKMSKEELRQELRETETSPELKAVMSARRRRLSKSRLDKAVREADVVVTNPVHYSVAIQYRPGKDHAPHVVAKGADLVAAKIRGLATEHRVPVISNPPLARALYRKCDVGDFVPRDLFQPVAEVLAYVYRTIKQVRP